MSYIGQAFPTATPPMGALDDLRAACAQEAAEAQAPPSPRTAASPWACPFVFGPWMADPLAPASPEAPEGRYRTVCMGDSLIAYWRAYSAPWMPLPGETSGDPCPTHQLVSPDGRLTLSAIDPQPALEELATLLGV